MPRYFENLPGSHDRAAAVVAVHELLSIIHKSGKSYQEVADEAQLMTGVELTVGSIRAFASRPPPSRVNSSNVCAQTLYDYIRSNREKFSAPVREAINARWAALVPEDPHGQVPQEIEFALGRRLQDWLYISGADVRRFDAKMSGRYVMLRKSVHSGQTIVKSLLEIRRTGGKEEQLHIVHSHRDRHNVERVSKGFVFSLVRMTYCVLRVEHGEGMEFLVLREPIQRDFEKMMGFLISMNMDRSVIEARVCVERDTPPWSDLPWRFEVGDIPESSIVRHRLALLDAGPAQMLPDA
jgi:hypothetical protein